MEKQAELDGKEVILNHECGEPIATRYKWNGMYLVEKHLEKISGREIFRCPACNKMLPAKLTGSNTGFINNIRT